MPALPLDEAGKYVAAAYLVAFALVLLYVVILGVRVGRMERELAELADLAERRAAPEAPAPQPAARETERVG